ncbi:MAG: glycosyltransferase family 9 protein [Candidatus Omnitrophica bacterium]|nr:glycosyltransferase family 9 protein [Candidatus Omnitrophota bacterium]
MKNCDEIRRILVITLSNTGDIILTTPLIEALLRQFPGVKLDIVVGPNGKEVFEKHNKVSKIFIYDKHTNLFEKFRLIKKLRKMHYDMAVDLKNSGIPFLIGARLKSKVIGRRKGRIHKKDQHLAIIESMGINIRDVGLNIEIDKEDFENIEVLLENIKSKFVVISCGAKSHTKRWPTSYFAALIDSIKNDLGYEVILVGKDEGDFPDSDRVVVRKVKKIMQTEPIDFLGKTNLRELAALIKKSSLLITNDSAPLHIASALNTPTIAIFGPTDEVKYGPLASKSIVLRKRLKCAPCEKAQCRYNYECMRQITVDDAINAVKEILDLK